MVESIVIVGQRPKLRELRQQISEAGMCGIKAMSLKDSLRYDFKNDESGEKAKGTIKQIAQHHSQVQFNEEQIEGGYGKGGF